MNELPIFVSYRQDDGMELARWVFQSIQGKTIYASEGTIQIPKTISVYFDQSTPPVSDWGKYLEKELERACVFIVVCSPGSASEFENDALYFEIRWWVTNRPNIPPILITPVGQRWIPKPIQERWPKAQTLNLSLAGSSDAILQASVERILNGITLQVRGLLVESGTFVLPIEAQSAAGMENHPGFYSWEKDKSGRYIRCNENYAKAAGFDSPHAMIGKTDYDMPWRSLADFFRQGDQKVMNAESPAREHVQEKEIMADRVADILVTENQLLTRSGACVGVTGYFLDITGKQIVPDTTQNKTNGDFQLGPAFGNQILTHSEAEVFKGLLRKFPAERIATILNITKSEVESHTASIMRKLQCQTLGDVIVTAIRNGLPFHLFGLR